MIHTITRVKYYIINSLELAMDLLDSIINLFVKQFNFFYLHLQIWIVLIEIYLQLVLILIIHVILVS